MAEAVAIAGQIADALAAAPRHDGRIVVPSFGDIRLQADGQVSWAYGRETRPEEVARAVAALLARLLRGAEQAGGRVPAALQYAVARALDVRAPAPLASLDELRRVLGRFAPEDRRRVIASLISRVPSSPRAALGALSTIADIRRARRERGVSLGSISGATGIPVSLLRELEWGLFENWRGTHIQEAVRAYAEAAGLDPDAVVAIVLPHVTPGLVAIAPKAGESTAVIAASRVSRRAHIARRYVSGLVAVLILVIAMLAWLLRTSQEPASAAASHAAAAGAPAATTPAPLETAPPSPAPAAVKRAPKPQTAVPATRRQRRLVARPTPPTPAAKSTIWNRPLLILKFGKPDPETGHQP